MFTDFTEFQVILEISTPILTLTNISKLPKRDIKILKGKDTEGWMFQIYNMTNSHQLFGFSSNPDTQSIRPHFIHFV